MYPYQPAQILSICPQESPSSKDSAGLNDLLLVHLLLHSIFCLTSELSRTHVWLDIQKVSQREVNLMTAGAAVEHQRSLMPKYPLKKLGKNYY